MTIISQERINAYAEVSGDRNPLHIDESFAATTAYGRTIAHGQLLLGLIIREIEDRYPGWASRGKVAVKFIAPVFAGETVEVEIGDGTCTLRVGNRTCVVGTYTLREEVDG